MRPLLPVHGLVEGDLAISESASNAIHKGTIHLGIPGGNLGVTASSRVSLFAAVEEQLAELGDLSIPLPFPRIRLSSTG